MSPTQRDGGPDANPAQSPAALGLARLDRRTRRHLIAGCALRITLTTGSLLAVYYWIPLDGLVSNATLLYFVVGAALFVGALVWQVRSILVADYPGLRAIETAVLALSLLIGVFAIVYASMAHVDLGNFSEPLSRTGSLYFTITVLATVGFGDITPKTDVARLVVSFQMLLDLTILGVLAKLIFSAARTGAERQRSALQDGNE
jgi:voltage-gated potassium channel